MLLPVQCLLNVMQVCSLTQFMQIMVHRICSLSLSHFVVVAENWSKKVTADTYI